MKQVSLIDILLFFVLEARPTLNPKKHCAKSAFDHVGRKTTFRQTFRLFFFSNPEKKVTYQKTKSGLASVPEMEHLKATLLPPLAWTSVLPLILTFVSAKKKEMKIIIIVGKVVTLKS